MTFLKDLIRWNIITDMKCLSAIPGIIAAFEVTTSNAVADVLILVGAAEVVMFSVKMKMSLSIIIHGFNHLFRRLYWRLCSLS